MIHLDELIYNAITSDATIMEAVGGRVVSTCFEVSPDEKDNTQLPCIIVMDNGFTNAQEDKDCDWESEEDRVQASVEIDAVSPREVRQLTLMVRQAVTSLIESMVEDDEDVPTLESLSSDGIAWDWLKPCYHSTLTYQCLIPNDYEQD
jgi:hypothetical protein